MAKVGAAWRAVQARLEAVEGLNPAPREGKQMLQALLGLDFLGLLGAENTELTEADGVALAAWAERRAGGEPLAYILGKTWFYGDEWAVSPAVLIPRPDSEVLVREALERLGENEWQRVAEVGTGSGAVLGSVLKERNICDGVGTDISEDAAAVARANLAGHGLTERARIVVTDMLAGVEGDFNLIMSNPPYITDNEWKTLEHGVRDFEPRLALVGGQPNPDGLLFYRRLVTEAPAKLAAGGWLCMETGWQQAGAVRELLQQEGHAWCDVTVAKDLAGRDRVVCARRAN